MMVTHRAHLQLPGARSMVGVLVCVSASHRTTNFAVLERLAAVEHDAREHLLDAQVRGAVVLATCNRFETYLDVAADSEQDLQDSVHAALDRVATRTGVPAEQLTGAATTMTASRVAAHLFAVASGLDSVVIGEEEIAGQVRRAYTEAHAAGTVSADLTRLFQAASTTSRGVKNSTRINAAGRSIVRLALDLADSRIPRWQDAAVLIIGTGAYAGASLAALRDRGARNVQVASPSGREQAFAARQRVDAVPAAQLPQALEWADLIVTSTNVLALEAPMVRAARAEPIERAKPLLIIDLGLPGNVAKDVTAVPGVELLDLETISVHAPVQELNASAQAHDLVDAAAREFQVRTAEQTATPAIVAYRSHIQELLEAELHRARARGEYSEDVERALRHFAGVLVHSPITRARGLAAEGRLDEVTGALATLYGLDVPGDPTGEAPQDQSGQKIFRTG